MVESSEQWDRLGFVKHFQTYQYDPDLAEMCKEFVLPRPKYFQPRSNVVYSFSTVAFCFKKLR